MSIARKEGEDFQSFKHRRVDDNLKTKQALQPKMFWDSSTLGTYVNEDLKDYKEAKKGFPSARQFKKAFKKGNI